MDDSSAEPPVLAERASSRETDAEESDGEEEDNRLKLGRFAYAAPHVPRRTASKTPSPSDADTGLSEAPVERRRTERAATHRFTTDFSDKELSRILRCIACDLAWTARKSVEQKMKHIQSCAKKHGLTDDTVRSLLRNELNSLPAVSTSKSNSSVEPTTPPAPDTLLEGALKDGQKKKGRRPQVLQTVKSVTETRSDILDKARVLLEDTRSRALAATPSRAAKSSLAARVGTEVLPSTQAFSTSSVAERNALPETHVADTTQAFGPSRLGTGPASRVSGIIIAGAAIAGQSDVSLATQSAVKCAQDSSPIGEDYANDIFPATQVFAPSKLTNMSGVTDSHPSTSIDGTFPPFCANEPEPDERPADPPDDLISLHDTSSDDCLGNPHSSRRPVSVSLLTTRRHA